MGWADMFKQPSTPNPNGNPYERAIGSRMPTYQDYLNLSPEDQAWARSQLQSAQGGIQAPAEETGAGTTQPVGQPQLSPQDQAGTAGGQNIQQIVQQFLQGKPSGEATLQALKAHLASMGINIEIPTRAGGSQSSQDKIVLPDRSVIDLWGDEGGAMTPQWTQDGYWVNGQASARPDMVYQDPNDFEGQGFSQYGRNGLASFDAPGINKPFTQEFSFNPSDMANSEAYQFAMSEGLKGVTQNAAARGTLNTGGTLKDLTKYAGGLAAQNYGDEFDRRYRVYTGDKDTYFRNADSSWNRLSSLANYGAGAAGKYADSVASIYGNQGNVKAAQAGNGPWWQAGVNTGIAAGADALFNRK